MEKISTICLNMIVKNESKIIGRLLESVLPIIDCYCICDTGSTDNTIKIITDFFEKHKIPGKIVEEPFQNFAHNRNVSLYACNGMSDYILLLDADMILEIKDFDKKLTLDGYSISQGSEDFYYHNTRIVKNTGLCKYVGVTHEYISVPKDSVIHHINKNYLFIKDIGDGGSKTDKFTRDIKLLTEGIKNEPENRDRYFFYLANSYHDNGQYEKAIENYKIKIEYNGWCQETWHSYYKIGLCYKNLNDMEKAIHYWLEGYNFFPERIENLYEIINYYRIKNKHKLANLYYPAAIAILSDKTINKDKHLFLQNDVYTYKLFYEYSVFAYYNGVRNINSELVNVLNNSNDSVINRNLLTNLKFYKSVLKPIKTICLDHTFTVKICNTETNFVSSSSCLIPYLNGYLMNVRYVNYYYDLIKGDITNGKYIISYNKCVELDKEFNFTKEKMFDLDFDDRKYIGVEDIRIFNDNGEIKFTGTSLHQNYKLGIFSGKYNTNINETKMVSNEIKCSFNDSSCEKNWVYVNFKDSTHIIYNWFPLQICKLNEETKMIELVEKRTLPRIFSHFRGSTCGFTFTTSNPVFKQEIWFIVHMVSYETPRHYYHMFVVFDTSMNLLRYSSPFSFENLPIEYCLSLVVEEDRVIINYSTWDKTTRIGIYEKEYIDSVTQITNGI